MKKETRTIVFDEDLKIEAYSLEGIVQPFPTHFHEYYVVGYIEKGERRLNCKNREYTLKKGALVLFHPGDSHACAQSGEEPLDYRAVNISQEVMLDLAGEITGKRLLPGFRENVIFDDEVVHYLGTLHEMVMSGSREFEKEENLLLLVTVLIQKYGEDFENIIPECREEVEMACTFMDDNYEQRISLNQICNHAGLSKSALLRAFTKTKGVTPYRYLETIRINKAKKLLEQGMLPVEVAMQTGFSDQSHFTNYFTSFIGVAPGVYRDIFLDKGNTGGKQSEE